MSKTIALILNTTTQFFTNWLEDYTQMLPFEQFPTEKGRIIAQRASQAYRVGGGAVLAIEGFYVSPTPNDPKSETAWPISELVSFKLLPLSSERLEVRATCNRPVMNRYFDRLIDEIRLRWPDQNNRSRLDTNLRKDSKLKGGRPSHKEDIWAWEQINIINRPKSSVYSEWLSKKNRHLEDPKRHFDRIIKHDWGKNKIRDKKDKTV